MNKRRQLHQDAPVKIPEGLPKQPLYITDTDELAAFCTRAKQADAVMVDTEFVRENTYWPVLCLVQLAFGENADECALIDPLAVSLNLQPLFDLMRHEPTTKVFHAARQDLEIFYHLMGTLPHPVVDTQVMAMVCGYGNAVGFENLVYGISKRPVDKGGRFTDWSARPLHQRQIYYALADAVYLLPVYEALLTQLARNGRQEWIHEEMAGLLDENIYRMNPDTAWQRMKTGKENGRAIGILRTIAAWREREAQRCNQPRGRIMRDETLVEIASFAPRTPEDLGRIRGVGKKIPNDARCKSLLDAVVAGEKAEIVTAHKSTAKPRPSDASKAAGQLLRVLLKLKCEEFQVAQKLVASSQDLDEIALLGEEAVVRTFSGWRQEVFGNDALRLCRGDIGLAFRGGKIILIAPDGTP